MTAPFGESEAVFGVLVEVCEFELASYQIAPAVSTLGMLVALDTLARAEAYDDGSLTCRLVTTIADRGSSAGRVTAPERLILMTQDGYVERNERGISITRQGRTLLDEQSRVA